MVVATDVASREGNLVRFTYFRNAQMDTETVLPMDEIISARGWGVAVERRHFFTSAHDIRAFYISPFSR